MNKKIIWKMEYSITCLIAFAIVLLCLPTSFIKSKEAMFISKWNDIFKDVSYAFEVMDARGNDGLVKGLTSSNSLNKRKQSMMTLIKPYLRIKAEDEFQNKNYVVHYLDKSLVKPQDKFYFNKLYLTSDNMIVGIKDLNNTDNLKPMFIMMFDLNGRRGPNTWGKDIYGINVYIDGDVTSIGYGWDLKNIKKDCSIKGTGVACSHYYRIGGNFSE